MKLLKSKPFGKRRQIVYTNLEHCSTIRPLVDSDTGARTVGLTVEGADGYVYMLTLTYDDIAHLDQAYHS